MFVTKPPTVQSYSSKLCSLQRTCIHTFRVCLIESAIWWVSEETIEYLCVVSVDGFHQQSSTTVNVLRPRGATAQKIVHSINVTTLNDSEHVWKHGVLLRFVPVNAFILCTHQSGTEEFNNNKIYVCSLR